MKRSDAEEQKLVEADARRWMSLPPRSILRIGTSEPDEWRDAQLQVWNRPGGRIDVEREQDAAALRCIVRTPIYP